MRLIREKETQFDISGPIATVRIMNRERYQVIGDFGGILVEVSVESDDVGSNLTMLVNPHCAAPIVGTWADVVLDGSRWRLANEEPLWN
ncbi:MAG: hypothetical protein AAB570_01890 [Patescibacteria group bacterium]